MPTIRELQNSLALTAPEARIAIEIGFERFRLPRDWTVNDNPLCCKIAVMALDNIVGAAIDERHEATSFKIKEQLAPILVQANRETAEVLCETCERISEAVMTVRPV